VQYVERQTAFSILYFDSHSRTSMGLPAPNGKAVLLLIRSEKGLVCYVKELAKSLFGADHYLSMPYELTPIGQPAVQ